MVLKHRDRGKGRVVVPVFRARDMEIWTDPPCRRAFIASPHSWAAELSEMRGCRPPPEDVDVDWERFETQAEELARFGMWPVPGSGNIGKRKTRMRWQAQSVIWSRYLHYFWAVLAFVSSGFLADKNTISPQMVFVLLLHGGVSKEVGSGDVEKQRPRSASLPSGGRVGVSCGRGCWIVWFLANYVA